MSHTITAADARTIGDESHKVYLANWETKTRVAENNGVWNQDIQARVLEHIESLASNNQILAEALAEALERLDKIEAINPK